MSEGLFLHDDTKLSSATSSMLKKAKSFHKDMKSKFIRPSGKTGNSVKPAAKSLVRTGSFNDDNKVDGVSRKPELVRLNEESKKLLQALNYVKLICLRGLREQLAGSVTVVMEIVMDVSQLLNNAINQDSSVLASACSRLRQSLADLTRWSDMMLLEGSDGAIDLELADLHVNGMTAAVEDLVSLAVEKLNTRTRAVTCQYPGLSTGSKKVSDKCSSIDLPLTSRERELLEETSHLTATSGLSLSADDILGIDDGEVGEMVNGRTAAAPPKPPLPRHIDFSQIKSFTGDRFMSLLEDRPPALPVKKKRNMSSDNNICPLTATHSGRGLGMSLRMTGHSPASSVGSNPVSIASSLEDILDETDGFRKSSAVCVRQDSRLSNYDNMTETCSDRSSVGTRRSMEDETDGCHPPLPDKKGPAALRHSLHSLDYGLESYDNMALRMASASLSCCTVMKHHSSSELQSSQCALQYSSRSASFQSNVASVTSMRTAKAVSVAVADSGYISTDHIQSAATASCQQGVMSSTTVHSAKAVHVRVAETAYSSSGHSTVIEGSTFSQCIAPPLPPKLKHTVDSYMKMFGQCTTPSFSDIAERHSMHVSSTIHNFCFNDNDFTNVRNLHSQLLPPYPNSSLATSFMTPPIMSAARPRLVHYVPEDADDDVPALPPKLSMSDLGTSSCRTSVFSSSSQSSDAPFVTAQITEPASAPVDNAIESAFHSPSSQECVKNDKSSFDTSILEVIDVTDQLVFKKPGEEIPEVRGGFVEALVVHATAPGCGFMYQEAFLTTYRLFLSPGDLIHKLLYRYNHFSKIADSQKKKIANNTFSLLVRVVDDLCTATDEHILQTLMELVYQLLSDDELMLARTMRKKVLEKYVQHRLRIQYNQQVTLLSSYQLSTKIQSVMEFESKTVAQQMTLLDAELFQKIELPEILLWTKEQSEEHSPNLTTFTEHFNKMSYWCRTRILEQEDPRERERFFLKFIKIMKHLRRLNNFNSYLAILSAVDSAPVRRLEWQKQNIEVLKEYCRLIDCSAAFRAYRQVLAKTEPPCIPYIGLVLQDMTFVHIGNPDKLPDGQLNFTKCWQLYNIMDNMRRFKNCNYEFKKDSKVIGFFNNFDNYISEESLWQISETIKPRGSAQKKYL